MGINPLINCSMNKIKLSFLALITPLFFCVALAQEGISKMEFQALEGALSLRPVTAITKTNDGFIWIGTQGSGLLRFNGLSYDFFTHDFNNESTINSNKINALFVDSNGRLWIGTDAGLCYYNDKLNSFTRLKNPKGDNFEYIHISCFGQLNDQLLIGTYAEGVKQIDLNSMRITPFHKSLEALRGMLINDIKFSSKGDVFLSTDIGVKMIKHGDENQEIHHLDINGSTIHTTKLYIDHLEQLWIGTIKNGLYRANLKKAILSFDKMGNSDKRILSLTGGLGHVFVGFENEGITVLNSKGEEVHTYRADANDFKSITSDSVWSIFMDNESRLWLGYYNDGISVFDKHQNKFKSIVASNNGGYGLQGYDVKALAKASDGKLWVAVGDGVDIFNPKDNNIIHINNRPESPIKGLKKGIYIEDIFIDSKQNVWIATWGNGIFFLEKGSNSFMNYTIESTNNGLQTNKLRCFTEDALGNIWTGSFLQGVYVFNSEDKKFKQLKTKDFMTTGLVNKDVKDVFSDSYGNVWVGTTNGLFKIFKTDGEYVVNNMSNKIASSFGGHPSSKQILSINQTLDGRIWFCSNGGGLFYYENSKDNFTRLEIDNFKQSFVNAITETKKNELWVCGKAGVFKINLDSGEVNNFTKDDGLLNNYFTDDAILFDNHSNIFLGTSKGINYIDTNEISYNEYPAEPFLKEIKIFNNPVTAGDATGVLKYVVNDTESITLDYNQSVVTIDYESISYTRPEKNKYAYYLEGFETDWNYVGNKKSATYTNLSPGEYVFKLKVANNDGMWNETSKQLLIEVSPPWWKTTIAYILFGLCFIGAIISVIYFYLKRVNEQNTLRLERMKRKQEDDLQKQQLQFFTNISHEFRTPLTLIINPIKDLLALEQNTLEKGVRQKHQIIYKNAERLSRLINELMDFRKLQSDKLQLNVTPFDLIHQTKSILSFFKEECKRREITLDIKTNKNNEEVWADQSMLDKILFNLLSNAFKVTPNGGKITVRIDTNKKAVLPLVNEKENVPVFQISVKDSGPGIDQKEYKRIFKRFYQISQLNKTYYGSTGIGLEMVKSFIELHRGSIEVESEIGEGSTFIINIPYGKQFYETSIAESTEEIVEFENAQLNREAKLYQIEEILAEKKEKKKILIAEDNVDLQDYLASVLKDDYELIVAYDGQEAWLRAMEFLPDVIISDVIMPIMDGIEFCEKVKADVKTSHIPIVMLTSKDLLEDRVRGIDVGAEAYLIKPFEVEELKAIINRLLKSRQKLYERFSENPLTVKEEKSVSNIDNDFVQKVVDYIQENIENTDLNVENLSSSLFLSRSQMYRKIKALTGLSPNEFIRRIRLEKARMHLNKDKNMNVSEVAFKVGFLSASYFTRCYKKQYGELPRNIK